MSQARIICDRAEERSRVPELLQRQGIVVDLEGLATGDYVLSAAVAVERKAAGDLVGSILSDRLLPQLDLLAATYEVAIFLIEGDSWAGDRALKTPMLARLLHQITFRPNIVPWYSPNEKHTARFLAELARQEQRKSAAAPVALQAVPAARTPEDVLRALPQVGQASAVKLMQRFGTVAAVMAASRDELQQAIGTKRGRGVFELLNRSA